MIKSAPALFYNVMYQKKTVSLEISKYTEALLKNENDFVPSLGSGVITVLL